MQVYDDVVSTPSVQCNGASNLGCKTEEQILFFVFDDEVNHGTHGPGFHHSFSKILISEILSFMFGFQILM